MEHIVDLTQEDEATVLTTHGHQPRIREQQTHLNQTLLSDDVISISDSESEANLSSSSEEEDSFVSQCNNQIGGGKYRHSKLSTGRVQKSVSRCNLM